MTQMNPVLSVEGLSKSFHLKLREPEPVSVLSNVSFTLFPKECLLLDGVSGRGKSTILKMIYGNYRIDCGAIKIGGGDHPVVDLAALSPREFIQVRSARMNYVSQFLRVIPRVTTLDIVAEPLLEPLLHGVQRTEEAVHLAHKAAKALLTKLQIDPHLWALPPSTFSGGEQQRVNLARGFIRHKPLMLLDEPSASLDDKNVVIVIDLIRTYIQNGGAILGIFHDSRLRQAVVTRKITI